MDGEVAWRDLCDQLDNDMCKSFFRLNISIPGGGPRLDSVDSMDELIRLTCEQGIGTVGRDAISALLAASLFFELVHHPGPDYRQCVGCIRSRIPGGGVVRAIMGLHGSEIEYTIDDKPIGNRLSENDMCGSCGRYCLPVRFSIASRATPLRLGLAAGGKFYRISPPQPVDWYSHQQGLEAEFGLANHGVQPRTWCKTCHRRIAREHAINLASTSYRRLKRKSTLDISFARRPRKVRFIL